ncbi:MAG: hypothetical protein E7370_01155 [Clostridiales bacterium]|nr:hypothetical protein [Clostridiales bacterium]
MNFISYIQRQKQIIRSRHIGEEFLINGTQSIPVKSSEEIFAEINNLKGLNKAERRFSEFATFRRGDCAFKRAFAN